VDLPLRFFLDGELYVLVERRDAAHRDEGFAEVGRWEAEKVLASALSHADAPALRSGLGGQASERGGGDHHGVSQRLRSRLAEELDHLVLLRRRKPRYTLVLGKPEVVADLVDLAPSTDDPEDAWIEVLVVDDENQPVAGVEYEIELSDGRVQRGRTSEHGILRYEDMPEGSCKVRLLSVDARGWDVA
jgi:hypothetical protein